MKKVIYVALGFFPVLASAAVNLSGLNDLVTGVGGLLNRVIPLLFALAIIYFFWGVIQYIRSAGDPKLADSGKSIMIYGIIGIAVMASIYGLVNFLTDAAGLTTTPVVIPSVPLR
jgi:hypothetical protein